MASRWSSQEDVQTKIWPLPVRKINGIGPKAEVKLAKLHLHTIGDIAAQQREWLIDNFGKSYGAWMHDAAWGRDDRPVVTESEPVSMSRETTFDRDLHAVRDKRGVGRHLHRAVREAGRRPAAQGLRGQDHRHQAALRRLPDCHARPDHRGFHGRRQDHPAASPASASSGWTWDSGCGCWVCGWASWRRPTRRRNRSVSPSRRHSPGRWICSEGAGQLTRISSW